MGSAEEIPEADKHTHCDTGPVDGRSNPGTSQCFHVSPTPLADGQVLCPSDPRPHDIFFCDPTPPPDEIAGDYRKFLADRQVEQLLESTRAARTASAPSRKTVLFAFPCLSCAMWFRDKSRPGGHVYEVTLGGPYWCGDMAVRDLMASVSRADPAKVLARTEGIPQAQVLNELARDYWNGIRSEDCKGKPFRPEFLVCGNLTIVRPRPP